MNEFENNPQEQNSDIPAIITGFTVSFLFFLAIFGVGFIISVIN